MNTRTLVGNALLLGLASLSVSCSTQEPSPASSSKPLEYDSRWFAGYPVLGALPPDQRAEKLKELGSPEMQKKADAWLKLKATASKEKQQASQEEFLFGHDNTKDVWRFTSHQFGYIAQSGSGDALPIVQIGSVTADNSLKNGKLRVTLDRLRVAEYPGGGRHDILFTFGAQNQVSGGSEDVNFSQHYLVEQGQGAGIAGYPVFLGLNVGSYGVVLKGNTVNVDNEDDQKLMGFLENDTFKKGLELADKLNPAVPVVSEFALGIAKAFAGRHKNVAVQNFQLGLDFGGAPTGGRLAQGSYICVQAPDDGWDWKKWEFNKSKGQVVSASDHQSPIPFNYVVFAISKM